MCNCSSFGSSGCWCLCPDAQNSLRDVYKSPFHLGALVFSQAWPVVQLPGMWKNCSSSWFCMWVVQDVNSFTAFCSFFSPFACRLSWVLLYTSLIFVMSILMAVIATASSLFPQSSAFVIFLLFFLYGISSVSMPRPSHPQVLSPLILFSLLNSLEQTSLP